MLFSVISYNIQFNFIYIESAEMKIVPMRTTEPRDWSKTSNAGLEKLPVNGKKPSAGSGPCVNEEEKGK